MRAWITSMGRRTSIERVAHLMCEMYLRICNLGLVDEVSKTALQAQSAAPAVAVELPLSQQLLADSLGMTPVHINRVLKALRVAEAMTLQRNSLLITNPAKLVQIAGFDENYLHRRLRKAA